MKVVKKDKFRMKTSSTVKICMQSGGCAEKATPLVISKKTSK